MGYFNTTIGSPVLRGGKKRVYGFTLIELLVVISIIALLMGIMMPAFAKARQASKRLMCASGMRQISVAVASFAVDNNEQLIVATTIMNSKSNPWIWALLPYIDGDDTKVGTFERPAELWFCPSDKNPYPSAFTPHEQEYTSYAPNGFQIPESERCASQAGFGAAGGYKTSQIQRASECMLMIETSFYGQVYDADNTKLASFNPDQRGHHRNTSGFYHDGSMNLMYVDGHISPIKGAVAEQVPAPEAIVKKGHQFWDNLSLPTCAQAPELWGPGY